MDVHVIYISQILDTPVQRLYMLSNEASRYRRHRIKNYYRNYHRVILKKENAKKIRVLNVPNAALKTVQRRILERFLYQLPVSEYASAYVQGKSLRSNALPHIGKEVIVKLDISQFFDHIDSDMVFMVLRQFDFSDAATSLLTNLCICRGKLPQGAPTSPYLANLVMRHFDEAVGKRCSEYGIDYTRYCDDMTFSGSREAIAQSSLIPFVRHKLYRMGFSLNNSKTAVISAAQQQRVTGIVVNQKPSIPREMRRRIRQEVYYCKKYGIRESLIQQGNTDTPESYLRKLLGRISYARQIDPENTEMAACFTEVSGWMKQL